MSHAWFVRPQLLAAWSISFHIVWWRFLLTLTLLAGMLAAAWALDGNSKKKKK